MKEKGTKQKKVFVGMSGGVDSSVSALLLKKEGYEVIGVFIRPWDPAEDGWNIPCNWKEERREAMRVSAHLDIPLLTFDASKEYKQKVVNYLLAEYRAGRTPNPDIMCNKYIKFGIFYDWATKQGADFVATGHYAQNIFNDETGLFEFKISEDLNKDQTYFLWTLTQDKLKKIIFPIGDKNKTEVRALAEKFGLPNASKKDSQGLCFIGKVDFKEFLKNEIREKVGKVLNEKGEIIGQHKGSEFFTIGERHGFEIFKKRTTEKPYYVINKDIVNNTITVSEKNNLSPAEKLEITIKNVNWTGKEPSIRENYLARIRYRQPLQKCRLKKITNEEVCVAFLTPQPAIAGQSLVLYQDKICLGGGIIK